MSPTPARIAAVAALAAVVLAAASLGLQLRDRADRPPADCFVGYAPAAVGATSVLVPVVICPQQQPAPTTSAPAPKARPPVSV